MVEIHILSSTHDGDKCQLLNHAESDETRIASYKQYLHQFD